MKIYAGAIGAYQHFPQGTRQAINMITILESSLEEANSKGWQQAHINYPVSQGFSSHFVNLQAVPDYMVLEACEYLVGVKQ